MRLIEPTREFKRIISIFTDVEVNDELITSNINENPIQPENISIDFGVYDNGRFFYEEKNNEIIYSRLTASFDENENKIIRIEEMSIFDLPNLNLSLIAKTDVELEEVLYQIDFYDHYVGAIEDGTQYREAIANNQRILKELKQMGVYQIIFKDLALMFASPKDIEFNIWRK